MKKVALFILIFTSLTQFLMAQDTTARKQINQSAPLLLTSQDAASRIRLNQIGFYPEAPKIAVIDYVKGSDFFVKSVTSGEIVFKSKLSDPHKSAFSPEITSVADFTTLTKP